jgi:hypothetical protein
VALRADRVPSDDSVAVGEARLLEIVSNIPAETADLAHVLYDKIFAEKTPRDDVALITLAFSPARKPTAV